MGNVATEAAGVVLAHFVGQLEGHACTARTPFDVRDGFGSYRGHLVTRGWCHGAASAAFETEPKVARVGGRCVCVCVYTIE